MISIMSKLNTYRGLYGTDHLIQYDQTICTWTSTAVLVKILIQI